LSSSLLTAPQWALDSYFRTMSQSDAETINFDLILGRRRVAPFCSPLVAGKVVTAQGRQLNTFQPAYIKDKRRINPAEGLKRAIGERIGGGELSAQERLDAYIANQLQDQIDMVNRRCEIMAVEAIRTGKVTVTGDDYPAVVVDFQRDAALTLADLAGARQVGPGDGEASQEPERVGEARTPEDGSIPQRRDHGSRCLGQLL
jgi:hypothetical protein